MFYDNGFYWKVFEKVYNIGIEDSFVIGVLFYF